MTRRIVRRERGDFTDTERGTVEEQAPVIIANAPAGDQGEPTLARSIALHSVPSGGLGPVERGVRPLQRVLKRLVLT